MRAWLGPNPVQHLLLEACLLPEERARAALEHWSRLPGDQRLDSASRRLLPLLWARREDIGLPGILHSEALFWKQETVRTWRHNHRLLACANRLAESLQRAGIPLALIKGLPLALHA